MTDKTQPEALRLADALDLYATGDEHQRDSEDAAAELRRQHARIAELEARVQELGAMARENRSRRIVELEAQLEAIGAGGVQALSAEQAGFLNGVIALCTNRGSSPENIEAWDKDDRWIADLWRQAEAMLAVSPTPPAEQPIGELVVTKTKDGQIISVTRQDEDGRILSVIATSDSEEQQAQPSEVYAELLEPDATTVGLGAVWNRHSMRDFADRTHALRVQAATKAAPGEPSDAEIDAFLDSPGGIEWVIADKRERYRLLVRAALAKWAAPQQEVQEPFAWESTTPGYIKYITQARYEKFSPKVQRWYKPYKCSSCAAPQPAPAPLSDDVVQKTWALIDELEKLRSADRYDEDWDTLNKRDSELRAALAAQGGKA